MFWFPMTTTISHKLSLSHNKVYFLGTIHSIENVFRYTGVEGNLIVLRVWCVFAW